MKTINTITILASPEVVFEEAVQVHRWPDILPHYRWVKCVNDEQSHKTYQMSAWRSFIPIKWTSLTQADSSTRRIYFSHVAGLTKGMEVVWCIEPGGNPNESRVSIIHELDLLKLPVVNSAPGKFITGRVFIHNVAAKTLRHMKKWIEDK